MTYYGKPLEFYAQLAKKLEESIQAKRWFTIREAGEILGYGADNTAATFNALQNLVKYGFVIEEWHGKTKKYYLPMEKDE